MSEAGESYRINVKGVNVLLLRDGTEIPIESIDSIERGLQLLDLLDAAILQTATALSNPDREKEWRRRATYALRAKRLARPRLVQRINNLRTAANRAASVVMTPQMAKMDARRQAFMRAAYDLLGSDGCEKIWDRARADRPKVFAAKEGTS